MFVLPSRDVSYRYGQLSFIVINMLTVHVHFLSLSLALSDLLLKVEALTKLHHFKLAFQVLSEVMCGHGIPAEDGMGTLSKDDGELVRAIIPSLHFARVTYGYDHCTLHVSHMAMTIALCTCHIWL